MTDVLHYLFEEDLMVPSAEAAEVRSEVRSLVYDSFYGTPYRYKMNKTSRDTFADGSRFPTEGLMAKDEPLEPFDPSPMTKKPYVPPTEFNPDSPMPFGKTLDAPLG